MTAFATYWSSGGDIVAARGQALTEDDAKALRVVHLIRNAVFPQVPDGEAGGDDGDRNEDADAEG